MKLSADSPRRSGARRFGLELRRAIRARKTSASSSSVITAGAFWCGYYLATEET